MFGFGKKKENALGSNPVAKETPCCSSKDTTPSCCGSESKTTCACNSQSGTSQVNDARFIVLGACCKKSTESFNNVKQAVLELGFTDEVLNIGDNIEIAKYGVMQTPAFVINNKVVSHGRLIKVEEAKKLIEKSEVR